MIFFEQQKDEMPLTKSILQKSLEYAKTYDWEEITSRRLNHCCECCDHYWSFIQNKNDQKITCPDCKKEQQISNMPEWPKEYRCKKTGCKAKLLSADDPVMYCDNKPLLLTSDEFMIKDIII
jgi:hypothetical protein